MTHDEYCINVCGGKCCKIFNEDRSVLFQCPNQASNGSCNIFDEWKDKGTCGFVPPHPTLTIVTGPLMEVLDQLPDWVQEQCCYKHEELLNGTA